MPPGPTLQQRDAMLTQLMRMSVSQRTVYLQTLEGGQAQVATHVADALALAASIGWIRPYPSAHEHECVIQHR